MRKFLTLLALLCTTAAVAQQDAKINIDAVQLRKLQVAEVAISNLYVDSVDQEKLVEDAINGMLTKLDPHSTYTNAKATQKFNEPLQGNFEGIGVQFNILNDTLLVIQPVSKGPSERAGILAGDRIVRVDGRPIAGVKMPRDTIMSLLRGPKGTQVELGVVRRGASGQLTFRVTRDKIPVNSLDAAYLIRPGIGYIRLDNFAQTSGSEVREAIKKLEQKGMKSLILDLQYNGGGYLGAAVDVANEFLEIGDLIVYTEGRAIPRETYTAKGGGRFGKGRLAVLVDEFTASAAEIVSGAVQDHDRGIIVGRRTFGKGLVQRPVPLPDGAMIRLTVAHYYTPSGRCIQKPYEKGNKRDYDMDLVNRYTHGELTSIDSVHLDSSKVYKTLERGRIVYGGGGIMPDCFVPTDTTAYTRFYTALSRQNIINELSLHYIDQNRKALSKTYGNIEDFVAGYEVPQSLVDSIINRGKSLKVLPKDSTEQAETVSQLRFMLKALVAYDLSACQALSGHLVRRIASSAVPPHPDFAYTIWDEADSRGTDVWLYTRGLQRMGLPDIEIMHSSPKHAVCHRKLIRAVVKYMFWNRHDKASSVPKIDLPVAYMAGGVPLYVRLLPWPEAIKDGSRSAGTPGSLRTRLKRMNSDSCVMFAYPDEQAVAEDVYQPLWMMDDFLDDGHEDDTKFIICEEENTRMHRLAMETFDIVERVARLTPEKVMLRLWLEDDDGELDTLWARLTKYVDRNNFEIRIEDDEHAGEDNGSQLAFIDETDERISTWLIEAGEHCVTPESIYLLDAEPGLKKELGLE